MGNNIVFKSNKNSKNCQKINRREREKCNEKQKSFVLFNYFVQLRFKNDGKIVNYEQYCQLSINH